MKIIFKNQDNSIGIITPTDEALSFATVIQVAEKDVPHDLPYWIVEDSTIPESRTFRSAWEIDEEWIPFDVTDNILAGCIDSVYDAIYQRI
jgi:hypothetical protein